jgi:hypothetical protein
MLAHSDFQDADESALSRTPLLSGGKPSPDYVSHTVPDNCARCSCYYNDDDLDLTCGGGKECSGNNDRLSRERQAGAFEREAAAIMLSQLATAHGLAARVDGAEALSTTNIFRVQRTGVKRAA